MSNRTLQDNQTYKELFERLECLLEIVLLALIFYMVWRNGYPHHLFHNFEHRGKYVLMGLYALILWIILQLSEGFKFGYYKLTDVLISQWVALVIANFITYWQMALIANGMIAVKPFLLMTLIEIAFASLCCVVFNWIYDRMHEQTRMLMIYGTENALSLEQKTNMRLSSYHVDETVSVEENMETILGMLDGYDAVLINDVPPRRRNRILKYCYRHNKEVYIVPKISDIVIRGAEDFTLLDTPIITIKSGGLTMSQRIVKRALDILLSFIALIPATVIILIVAIAIKIEDHGPVFFVQKRVTRDGKVFGLLKLRSMVVGADKHGVNPTVDNDARITKVGHFIRPTRIDELPQLFNILSGKMSIVGPRPERVEHVKRYSEAIPEFVFREKVKAGLTGYAQIYGRYNTTAYDKIRLDLTYIQNYSLILDIKLIIRTLRVLFQKESTEGFEEDQAEFIRSQKNEQGR
ncbi:MAG: exopolysaccharide biosynthesis polyprenyl glycosylphosphotransferase [Clostridiales bacterium]|nr:exopolysaccharide biosynthesis polyprenyl glycosylphosphotransferase [Clostridiales bacterium]